VIERDMSVDRERFPGNSSWRERERERERERNIWTRTLGKRESEREREMLGGYD